MILIPSRVRGMEAFDLAASSRAFGWHLATLGVEA